MVCSFESINNKGGGHSCNTLRQIQERHGDQYIFELSVK